QPGFLPAIDEVEENIHIHACLGIAEEIDGQAAEVKRGADLLDVHLEFDQLQARRIARDLELPQQRSVGVVLVVVSIQQGAASILHKLREGQLRLEAAAN